MTADDLCEKLVAENFTKSSALAALSVYSSKVNRALFKSDTATEIDGLTRDNAEAVLNETKKKLEEIEPLVITLAVTLPDKEMADLTDKIHKLYGRNLMFDVNVNTAILAGAQLVYKGKMLDLSLKNKIESSKPLIIDICNKYLS